jgi:hypothetical protein
MLEGRRGMMQTSITWRLTASMDGAPDDEARAYLEQHFDQVMEELVKLDACHPEVHDPSLAADLSRFPKTVVEVEILVDGHGPEALSTGESVLRSAIHSAGGYTQHWDETPSTGAYYKELSVQLEPA